MTVEAEMLITGINRFWKYQSVKMLPLWCTYNICTEKQTQGVW